MTLSATAEKRVAEATRFRWFPNIDPYANYSNVLTQLDSEDLGTFCNNLSFTVDYNSWLTQNRMIQTVKIHFT